jgi:hypothetical protein
MYNQSAQPSQVNGNVYLNGAIPFSGEVNFVHQPEFDPSIRLTEENDTVFLEMKLPQALESQINNPVTTELLGKARISGAAYENPDGSPIIIDSDYFGNKRNERNPTAGPFESSGTGLLRMIIWQKNH